MPGQWRHREGVNKVVLCGLELPMDDIDVEWHNMVRIHMVDDAVKGVCIERIIWVGMHGQRGGIMVHGGRR